MKWPLDEKENQKMMLELQRYAQLFQFALSIEGFELLSQTSSDISQTLRAQLDAVSRLKGLSEDAARDEAGLSKQISQLLAIVASVPDSLREIEKISRCMQKVESKCNETVLQERRNEKNRRRLLKQLSRVDYEYQQRKLRETRHPGTGTWITYSRPYKDWDEASGSSCLCCYGIPGAGKTVLASSVVDTLAARIVSQRSAIAYYYCDYSDLETLEISTVLGTIIKQLLVALTKIPEHVEEQLNECFKHNPRKPDYRLLTGSLLSVIAFFSEVFIVVDGVDELQKEEQVVIVSILKRLTKVDDSIIKIFVTSRREEMYITRSLEGFHRIDLSTANIASDITSFVKDTVRSKIESGELVTRDPSLEQDIVKALADGAHGMFLWVTFQLIELCEAITDAGIRETLRTLPEDLAATYKRILERKVIQSPKGATKAITAQKIFKWIICAKRPLRIDELKEAVGVEPTDDFWNPDKIPTNSSHLIQCCGNLVVLDREDTTVRLAHYTVQQFLLSGPSLSNIPTVFHFQRRQADVEIGEICVAYLSFSDFETQITKFRPKAIFPDVKVVENAILSHIPFLRVAIKVLSSVLRRVRGSDINQEPPQIDYSSLLRRYQQKSPSKTMEEKFLLLSYVIDNWLRHTTSFSEENTKMWRQFRSLALERHMQFDHRPWGENHIQLDLPYLALFKWGVGEGHASLLRLLLQPPVGPNLQEYYHRAIKTDQSLELLRHTCRQGHAEVLSLFFSLCPNARSNLKDNRLVIDAAGSQHEEALIFLLNHGANANAKDSERCLALCTAVEKGRERAAEALLAYGAEVNATGRHGRTVLHVASESGHEAMVRLLLKKGADVNAIDKNGETSFHVAAKSRHKAIVRLLRENGANINVRNKWGDTALHMVAEIGLEAMVQPLRENGADINAKNRHDDTALHIAVKRGHEAIVRLLLKNGANVDAWDKLGDTALHIAAKGGHEAIVRMLRENGADVNVRNKWGDTALHMVAEIGLKAMVRPLRENGADIVAKDKYGQTALHQAAESGNAAMVRLLLEKGGDATVKDDYGQTALHIAVENHHKAVIELLRPLTR